MTIITKIINVTFTLVLLVSITACAPEVGSDTWCKAMQETPKGDWSMNDAGDYAKHCILK